MPENAQIKLQDTLQRIVNEGSGGLICINHIVKHLDGMFHGAICAHLDRALLRAKLRQ